MKEWIEVDKELPKKTEHRPNSMGGYKNPIPRQPNVLVSTSSGRVFETLYCAFGWANLRGGEEVLAWQPLPTAFSELLAESKPLTEEFKDKVENLVEGVGVDLHKPLKPYDD